MGSGPWDAVVAGGGIVGLAVGMRLLQRFPRLRLLVLEKESAIATQQTGHNSGVIHAGVYYAPGSTKARFCVAGRQQLLAYCDAREISYRLCGKLIVALYGEEVPRLEELARRALANGVQGTRLMTPGEMREIEPHVAGVGALFVPGTGVIDFVHVARAYADDIRRAGGVIETSRPVLDVLRKGQTIVLSTPRGEIETRRLIACAGLYSDRLAERAGAPPDARIVPFRGDYYELTPRRAHLCRALIYPVPDPDFPFLGVHFTRLIDGRVLAGPNAVLAWSRQGYGRWDLNLADLIDTLRWSGFWRLAAKYWRTGMAELWRDYCKSAYVRTMQAYLPALRAEDVRCGPSGVRAQALAADGRLLDDFSFHVAPGMLAVRNAPSPAATSSLAIADAIVERAEAALGLE